MNLNPDRKILYIRITCEILEKEGVEGVTIRKVAAKAGCTSAVLYRHFENKEHLLMLASVKFLEPCMTELMKQTARQDITFVQMNLLLWKCFIYEAFRNKPYYELMFFSEQKDTLEACIYEYCQIFPEARRWFGGLSSGLIFSNHLGGHKQICLRYAAYEGQITMENADLLGSLTAAVFCGMFLRYSKASTKEADTRSAADDCYHLIYVLFQRFAEPGIRLDVK